MTPSELDAIPLAPPEWQGPGMGRWLESGDPDGATATDGTVWQFLRIGDILHKRPVRGLTLGSPAPKL